MTGEDKVKTTIYMSPETWDRLVLFIREKYGRDVKAVSITIEEAVQYFLNAQETIKTPEAV